MKPKVALCLTELFTFREKENLFLVDAIAKFYKLRTYLQY